MEDDFDADSLTTSVVDLDYEFDAARFFDFTRPESSSEAQDAQNWFPTTIGSYPHSRSHHKIIAEDISKAKTKTSAKSSRTKSSTLMKPTASHLAKINYAKGVFGNSFGRSDCSSITSDDRISHSCGVVEATKRQKLENGYLCKVRPIDARIINFRSKVTKPREPNFETSIRAQRHRLKNTIETGECAKESAHVLKARSLNLKICKSPSFRHARKNTPSPVNQIKTQKSCIPASRTSVPDALRMIREDNTSKNGECEIMKREAAHSLDNKLQEGDLFTLLNEDNSLPHNPLPIELFGKLSLKSEPELITVSVAKDYKENIPGCFNREIQINECFLQTHSTLL